MKTRFLMLLAAVLLSMGIQAHDALVSGVYYNLNYNERTAEVTYRKYYLYSGAVTIPENIYYNGVVYSVTSIGEDAFKNCSNMTSITIPRSIKSVAVSVFDECNSLKSVYISDLESWCGITFGNYSSNPLYYAHHLYLNGEEVKDLVIPERVTSIGNQAFHGCSGLTSVTIHNNVKEIGAASFARCSGLSSITIPESVKVIGEGAFFLCSGLTSVSIPNSITTISRYAFRECSSLSSITIPTSVTSIGVEAFSGCSALSSIIIPNNVVSIGSNAFGSCSNLTAVLSFVEEPFKLVWTPFRDIAPSCVLLVPQGKKDDYIDKGWTTSYFKGGIMDVLAKQGSNNKATYDVNGDGEVNISDVTMLVNVILGKIVPENPGGGEEPESQYTTIYWGWTDATHMFKDAQNSTDPTIYPELTLLDPTTVDFKVSGNGVTANTVNVSGNRWQSPVVDVDSRRTLYVAVPTGWGIERWEETLMHSLQLYIQWIDREDGYTLYYNYFPLLEYNDQMFIIKKGLPKGYDVE